MDAPESIAVHVNRDTSDQLDALIDAMVKIYGQEISGVGRSVDRYAALRDFTLIVIQLIAPDPNREKLTDDVRQSIKLGVRRLSSRLSIMQQGGKG